MRRKRSEEEMQREGVAGSREKAFDERGTKDPRRESKLDV